MEYLPKRVLPHLTLIEDKKEQLSELCRKYHVCELDVFGSIVSGDFDEETSDIDFAVKFDSGSIQNRFDAYFGLRKELESLFGRAIDLIEPGGLRNPYFIMKFNDTKRVVYVNS